jgi:Abi-like protein.
MKNIEFDKTFFENSFSSARMKPYFDRYPGDEKKAVRHYKQNIQLAEALLPSLSIYEVALRNSLIRELERMTGRQDWYAYFATIPALNALDNQVAVAMQHITKRGEVVTPDKLNGELTMGFWVLLFNAKYEQYLWKYLRKAFPYMPKRKRQRKNVSAPLNDIRSIRNRVFHNESVSWSLTRLEDLHKSILEVCSWINPALPLWIKTVERFDKTILAVERSWYGWWRIFRK